jgi:FkbM family methyltransferase
MKKLKKIRHYHATLGAMGAAVFVLSKLSGKRPLFKVSVPGIAHPVQVRIGTTDASVLGQVLIEKHYDMPFEVHPKVIIDAGANIGLSAVYFANKYPNATIIALEPEASNFSVLEANARPYPQIKPLNAALWKENGKICLVDPDQGHHGFQTLESRTDGCWVEAMTVDALMAKFGLDSVDILKIDIEGAEKEVFETSAGWIQKVGMVMAELHDNLKPGCSRAHDDATREFPRRIPNGEIIISMKAA